MNGNNLHCESLRRMKYQMADELLYKIQEYISLFSTFALVPTFVIP